MENKTGDDIGLEDIRNYLKSIKSFYSRLVSFLVTSIKHYKAFIIIGIILGAGFACFKDIKDKPYYFGKASFTYNELHKRIYGEMIDKLRNLTISESFKTLGEKLKLSEKEASGILDIVAVNIAGSPLSEDQSDSKLPFYIRVKLIDRNLADTLLHSLENYFNNNYQTKAIVATNSKQMADKIAFFKSQLTKLDSLKSSYRFYLSTKTYNTANNTINTFNPIDLYTESEKLFNATSDLESILKTYKAVKILDQFILNDVPVKTPLAVLLILYMGIGFIATTLLSLFLYALKMI
ncbi:MAG TPA: hypothetical protein VK590_12585 [Saprospiraceae bacterium]|nr:hypothetical protein [Saprospiraceae bacterium]